MKKSCFLSVLVFSAFIMVGCSQEQGHTHNYDFNNPSWSWDSSTSGEGYSAKVTLACKGCNEATEGHFLTLTAEISESTINPTCESDGSITYNAYASYKNKLILDTKIDSIEKLGHKFETINVEGSYKKNYYALESFDSSEITVKGTCSREGCGRTITLTESDYFVIYQSRGADHLCAGDTKVTISSNYSPFAKFELSGLTVTKIPNAINGMENAYSTSCHHAPDLSGVTALSGDLEIKYYSDSGCTQEVALNNLIPGNYYIKAIAGDINHEQISKTATLSVAHAYDQCVEEDTYLHNSASRFENAKYYKSCLCGAASVSSNDLFEVDNSKLPYVTSPSAFDNYEASSINVPEGYQTVSKSSIVYTESNQGNSLIGNLDYSDVLDKMSFMILTKNNALCQNNWSIDSALSKDKWYLVEIIKNDDSSFSSTIKDDNGKIKIQYSNKAISSVLPYYQWGQEPYTEIYSTEVYGVRLHGEKFDQLISNSSVPSYTLTDIVSPIGYQTVTLNNRTFDDSDQNPPKNTFLDDIDISSYQTVSFAFKTKNRRFCYKDWSSPLPIDTWHICTFERNQDGSYECAVKTMNGVTKFSYQNINSFKEGLIYANWDGSAPKLEWYSTEVRGVLR